MNIDKFEESLDELLVHGRKATAHEAKLLALSIFLNKAFNVEIISLLPGIEKKLGVKIYGIRGSIDLLLSDVIFELKTDFSNEFEDAKDKIKKYFIAMHEKYSSGKFIGIATDLNKFVAFNPVLKNGKVIDIKEIGRITLKVANPYEASLWMNEFFFSKEGFLLTAEELNTKFGPESNVHDIIIVKLNLLWSEVYDLDECKLKFRLWEKNMNIVYGDLPHSSGFFQQTYLVTIVKLLVYLKLSGVKKIDPDTILQALTGEYFVKYGITNLIEEDYFSWVLTPKIRKRWLEVGIILTKHLLTYNISAIDEDLFKEIYQTIISKAARHATGEHYTPEWLAEITLREALKKWKNRTKSVPRILDPACGSGTFLTNAILLMKYQLKEQKIKKSQRIDLILENIVGIDLNPLAIIIARANYIIALGDLIDAGKKITLPVYVSDSIKIPNIIRTLSGGVEVCEVEAENVRLQLPLRVFSDQKITSKLLEILTLASTRYRDRRNRKEAEAILTNGAKKFLDANETHVVLITLQSIMELIDQNLNSIWMFYLKNIYAPISHSLSKFDIIVGNPPWIVMSSLENKSYQDFLVQQVLSYDLINKGKGFNKLYTSMEMATLFFCKTSELYLHEHGIIANLLPISVMTAAKQHENFKKFLKPKMKLLSILDFTKIPDIFSLPVCVWIAKNNSVNSYPIKLSYCYSRKKKFRRNAKLSEIKGLLKKEKFQYKLPEEPPESSWSMYYHEAAEGSTLVPRSLWFVDFNPHNKLPMDLDKPSLKTPDEIIKHTKEPYKDIELHDNLEAEYLNATMLGRDLIPYGRVKFRMIFLPIEKPFEDFDILDVDGLRNDGKILAGDWVAENQQIWEDRRKDKSAINYPRVIDRLDRQGDLRKQGRTKRFVLVWNARGADSFAHVYDNKKLPRFKIGSSTITARHIVTDTTILYASFDNEDEAHYLCAIMNSHKTNADVKPFQPRGKYGYRDMYRRQLMLSIPKFKKSNKNHQKLVKISKQCHKFVENHNFKSHTFKAMRNEVLKELENDYKKLDSIVKKII